MWEWDVRVLDIQDDLEGDQLPMCLSGRGAAPPEFCSGPTGYRLMLKRQREGDAMSNPVLVEAGIQMFAAACPEQPGSSWNTQREAFTEAMQSVDRRLRKPGRWNRSALT
jgi:Plasmid pRiA4b ORF-3-like protein